ERRHPSLVEESAVGAVGGEDDDGMMDVAAPVPGQVGPAGAIAVELPRPDHDDVGVRAVGAGIETDRDDAVPPPDGPRDVAREGILVPIDALAGDRDLERAPQPLIRPAAYRGIGIP